jgi:hypothetical protein
VKSGHAVAVLVTGSAESPQVLDRRTIELSDPAVPESRQPYHAARGTLETDNAKVERRRQIIAQAAQRSVTALLDDYRCASHVVRAAGLVVGSTIDPARVTNEHIRAHALEGQLFRTVLEEALRAHGLLCAVNLERRVYGDAAQRLGKSEKELKQEVTRLGRSVGGPWRADEKTATLAAWLGLA